MILLKRVIIKIRFYMKKNFLFLFAMFCLMFTNVYSAENRRFEKLFESKATGVSQTELYLKVHPFEKIEKKLGRFNSQVSFVTDKMIDMETNSGFFGYHGCTQRYRIFQDILRAVFEETMDFEIPADFQFLRIPGDEMFALKNNKQSFYKLFDRKPASRENRNKIIDALFLQPFNEGFRSSIAIKDLSSEENNELWILAEDFVENLDSLAMEDYYDFEFEEKDGIKSLGIFEHEIPNQNSMKSIQKKLQMMMHWVDKQKNKSEDSVQALAIPSIAVERITKIYVNVLSKIKTKNFNYAAVKSQIAKNYTFRNLLFSTYKLTYNEMNAPLLNYFFPYNDTRSEQQSRIICINIPLYGNYHRSDESSVKIFLNDNSIEGGDSHVMGLLANYFENIGLNKDLPLELRRIAVTEISNAKNKHGCIMQFFDVSENNGEVPLQGVNSAAYVSHTFGIPLKNFEPSQLLYGEVPIRRKELDLQLRLIPSNHTTLNPYGFLRVVRHDTLDPEISKKIISKMRDRLKTGIVDADKLNTYKAEMDMTWSLD
ncbi:MAG: hypothetical protein H0W50_02895 [Parachlamydiaceae bacterium]|nr:hypothetical protein [Parachlamydiaceae bacterium]